MPHTSTTKQTTLTQVLLEQRDELPILRIGNRHADAAIALQGAQVIEYTPRGARPVIWLSEQAEYRRGQGQRGGIPICWPWFGAIERNPSAVRKFATEQELPAHGLVRTRDWTIRSIREHDDSTEVTLSFVTDNLLQRQWPYAAELQLRVTLGKTLRLALTTRNLDTQPIALTQALHTYFAISSIDKIHLCGFENARYLDTLDDWYEYRQNGEIRFTAETDRIYLDVPRAVRLYDSGWNRTIHLHAANSASAVVWNPWIEKSKRLSQFPLDAWRAMVCIETANVLDDRVEVAPQAEHTLALEIRCEEQPA
jgi:glucose-6-phosphate 1-epimerase